MKKGLHPVQAFFQLLVTVAVGQTDVCIGAEAASGDGGDLSLPDHPGTEGLGVHAVFLDVREHIEGALRLREVQPHPPQPGADIAPASGINLPHRGRVSPQGSDGSLLYKGGHRRDLGSA